LSLNIITRRHFGALELVLLYAVLRLENDEAGACGPTIRKAIEVGTGRTISPGAIYTALDRLERRGFVRSELGDPTPERGGKRKRFYWIRPVGLAALRSADAARATMTRVKA
jgi:PadR family transcriptional regulator PadR